MFAADSRYAGQPLLDHVRADGEPVRYVTPRLLPQLDSFEPAFRHRATDSDRIDLLAWKNFGAPTASWKLADANRAMHPGALPGEPGDLVVIPVPGTGGVAA